MSGRPIASGLVAALLAMSAASCSGSRAAGPPPSATGATSATTTGAAATTPTASTPPPTADLSPALRNRMREALSRAVTWSAGHLHETDPFTLVLLDYFSRRFGIDAFSGARSIAVEATANESPASNPELRLLRPTVRPSRASVDDPQADPSAAVVTAALACDEPGLPANFEAQLRSAGSQGGYQLTHALLALGLERELGCAPTGGAAMRAFLVGRDVAAIARDRVVDDMSVERLAILGYAGAADLVPADRLTALLNAQLPDGSYAGSDVPTQAHTVALAIWVFAAQLLQPVATAAIAQKG